MNKSILLGRLTKAPEYKVSNDTNICRYTLAVDRRTVNKDGEREADFISIVAFGKAADFANKYFTKGMKVLVTGHIQTGSYTNKDGIKVYTTDIIAEDQEFCESKKEDANRPPKANDGFMNIPEGLDEELPFNPPTR